MAARRTSREGLLSITTMVEAAETSPRWARPFEQGYLDGRTDPVQQDGKCQGRIGCVHLAHQLKRGGLAGLVRAENGGGHQVQRPFAGGQDHAAIGGGAVSVRLLRLIQGLEDTPRLRSAPGCQQAIGAAQARRPRWRRAPARLTRLAPSATL